MILPLAAEAALELRSGICGNIDLTRNTKEHDGAFKAGFSGGWWDGIDGGSDVG
jgi:hypothetical protein